MPLFPTLPTEPKGEPPIITSPSKGANNNSNNDSIKDNLRRLQRSNKPIMQLIAALSPIKLHNSSAFYQTPVPSGPQQTTFRGTDCPHQVDRDTLSQQYFAGLKWDSLLNVMEASYSSLGSFIAEHKQYLSYGNLVEYLNPALFITLANKEDNPIYREEMYRPNKTGFIAAMGKEMLTLMELDLYEFSTQNS